MVASVKGFLQRLFLDRLLPALWAVMRRLHPRLRLGRYVVLLTFDDVQEVLAHGDSFVAPYGSKAQDLKWCPQFLLGIENVRGDDYVEMHETVRRLWHPNDTSRVAAITRDTTHNALRDQNRPVDAMQSIIVASAVNVVERYFGVPIPSPDRPAFVAATSSVLSYLFNVPKPSRRSARKAGRQAAIVFSAIDAALESTQAPVQDSVVDRARRIGVSDDLLRTCLMGMISGFIPAFTNGAGRALHVMLDRPEASLAMHRALAAVDTEAVKTLCYEALRFRYVLPFLWRRVVDRTVIGANSQTPYTLYKGDYAVLSPLSAMQDADRVLMPGKFLSGRSPNLYLTYGYAWHDCIGRWIADALLIEIFSGLNTADVRRHRRTKWSGMVPANIYVTVDPTSIPTKATSALS